MKGIGVDIVEFARILAVRDIAKFVERILSEDEKNVYFDLKNEKRKLEYIAGRFAVKEAIFKAAPKICKNKEFYDFTILNNESGAPFLLSPNIPDIFITLSHSDNYVVAFVIYQ